jgi:predicted adenylyl cyclase CyaB
MEVQRHCCRSKGAMMKEIEIRAIISEPARVQERLVEAGVHPLGSLAQKDIMLDKPDASFFNSGRKIRIRIEGSSAELTYKGPFEGTQDASRRSEVNISVSPSQVEDLVLLFTAIGYPVCFTVPKNRTTFARGNIKVTFDDWPIIGCLMEIEGDEDEARRLASEVAPNVEFSNYRLKELFRRAETESGKSLRELQEEYEALHGVSLGRLDLLIK